MNIASLNMIYVAWRENTFINSHSDKSLSRACSTCNDTPIKEQWWRGLGKLQLFQQKSLKTKHRKINIYSPFRHVKRKCITYWKVRGKKRPTHDRLEVVWGGSVHWKQRGCHIWTPLQCAPRMCHRHCWSRQHCKWRQSVYVTHVRKWRHNINVTHIYITIHMYIKNEQFHL